MIKYLIQTPDYKEVYKFFMANFNSVQHVVAIAETKSGTVMATNDNDIYELFVEKFPSMNPLQPDILMRIIIDGGFHGVITGHEIASRSLLSM